MRLGRLSLVLGALLITIPGVNLISAAAGGPALGVSLQGGTGETGLSDWFSKLVTLVTSWAHSLDPIPQTTAWKTDIYWNSKYQTVDGGYELCRQIGDAILCMRYVMSGTTIQEATGFLSSPECGGACLDWFPAVPSGGPNWPRHEFWRVMIQELRGELAPYIYYETLPAADKADWPNWETARADPAFAGGIKWMELFYGQTVSFTDGPEGVGGNVILTATTPTKATAISSCDGLYLPYYAQFGCTKTTQTYRTSITLASGALLYKAEMDPVGVVSETVIGPTPVADGKLVTQMQSGDTWHWEVITTLPIAPELLKYVTAFTVEFPNDATVEAVMAYMNGLSLVDKMIFVSWFVANWDQINAGTLPTSTFDKYAKNGDDSILRNTPKGNLIEATGEYSTLPICQYIELKRLADKRRIGAIGPMIPDPKVCYAAGCTGLGCAVEETQDEITDGHLARGTIKLSHGQIAGNAMTGSRNGAGVWHVIWGKAGGEDGVLPMEQTLKNALRHASVGVVPGELPNEASLYTDKIVRSYMDTMCSGGECLFGERGIIDKAEWAKLYDAWNTKNLGKPNVNCKNRGNCVESDNPYEDPQVIFEKYRIKTTVELEYLLTEAYYYESLGVAPGHCESNGECSYFPLTGGLTWEEWIIEKAKTDPDWMRGYHVTCDTAGSCKLQWAEQHMRTAEWQAHNDVIKMAGQIEEEGRITGHIAPDDVATLCKQCEEGYLSIGKWIPYTGVGGQANDPTLTKQTCAKWAAAVRWGQIHNAYPAEIRAGGDMDARAKEYADYMGNEWAIRNHKSIDDPANPYKIGWIECDAGKCETVGMGERGWAPGEGNRFVISREVDFNTAGKTITRTYVDSYRTTLESCKGTKGCTDRETGITYSLFSLGYSEWAVDTGTTRFYLLCVGDICKIYDMVSLPVYMLVPMEDYFQSQATYHVSRLATSMLFPVGSGGMMLFIADLLFVYLAGVAIFLFVAIKRRRSSGGSHWRSAVKHT